MIAYHAVVTVVVARMRAKRGQVALLAGPLACLCVIARRQAAWMRPRRGRGK